MLGATLTLHFSQCQCFIFLLCKFSCVTNDPFQMFVPKASSLINIAAPLGEFRNTFGLKLRERQTTTSLLHAASCSSSVRKSQTCGHYVHLHGNLFVIWIELLHYCERRLFSWKHWCSILWVPLKPYTVTEADITFYPWCHSAANSVVSKMCFWTSPVTLVTSFR